MLTFGVRGHDFGKLPVDDLAARIAAKRFSSVQLALAKAVAGIDCGPGRLNPGLARYIGTTFARHQIEIAVLGCYVNLIHPDPAERQSGLERFKEHLCFARDFGCSIVGTETGSCNPDYSFNPDNHSEAAFGTLTASLALLVAEAEKFGVFVGIEAVHHHVIHTPQKMKRMLDSIASNHLQVIYDPVNLLSPENHQDQERIIQDSFELFGDRMMVLHAKDFIITNHQISTVPAGKGLLNYPLVIKLLKQSKPYIYTLLEDTKPELLDESRTYLNNLFQTV